MDVPVSRRRQRRANRRLLPVGNAGSRGRQNLPKKGLGECGQSAAGRFRPDGLRGYPAAIRDLQEEGHLHVRCRQRTRKYCNNRIESDHRHVKRRLRAMQGPRTTATAWAVIQGIEAAQMIRKGQVLGITSHNLFGQAWVFGALLKVA